MASGKEGQGAPDLELLAAVGVLALVGIGLGGVLLGRLERPAARLDLDHLLEVIVSVVVWLGVAACLVGGGLLAMRAIATLRALRTREAWAVLPPGNFEPRPEQIEVFGQQLLGARRRLLAWLDRPACAIRVRLTTTVAGRVLYVVEVPRRFRGSLFNAFSSAYSTVDLRPLAEVELSEAADARAALPEGGADG